MHFILQFLWVFRTSLGNISFSSLYHTQGTMDRNLHQCHRWLSAHLSTEKHQCCLLAVALVQSASLDTSLIHQARELWQLPKSFLLNLYRKHRHQESAISQEYPSACPFSFLRFSCSLFTLQSCTLIQRRFLLLQVHFQSSQCSLFL